MPRSVRPVPSQGCMHIMCRGNNRQVIFTTDNDFRSYYRLLFILKEENEIDIYHYCLMQNHVHLIAGIREQSRISKYMKQVNLTYFHYFKREHDYCGHLWQGRFKSSIIEENTYLLQCGKYIELNPVRAGIVKTPDQYMYSSFSYYAKGAPDKLVTENPLYGTLGPTSEKRCRAYVHFVLSEEIRARMSSERFIGTEGFVGRHTDLFSMKNTRLKRGRPLKNEKSCEK